MRFQPNRDYISDDVVQTPLEMAGRLVRHFAPKGRILEPCCGQGNFLHHLPGAMSCEIQRGEDFFDWDEKVDWIITNPPWSQIRPFLCHAMEVADEVVFLMTVNHVWTKARLRDIREQGFGLREIVLVEMPPEFPQSGFQLGAIHVSRGWRGPVALTDLIREAAPLRLRKRPGAPVLAAA
ncbi:MAG: hypothetical protein SFU85_08690 [Candidatus Methylacidiphilales bacterium]|nr:hypothetical protein [Candidatus Methylacidiphilales bacterium]